MYADQITGSVKRAVAETERRRKLQIAHNKRHGITPQTIVKNIRDILPDTTEREKRIEEILRLEVSALPRSEKMIQEMVKDKEREMRGAAKALDFELAAILRDEIFALREKLKERTKHGTR